MKRIVVMTLGVLALMTSVVSADVPQWINFQGRLTDNTGTPLTDGTYQVAIGLYNQASGGVALWNDSFGAPTKNGYFNIILGSGAVPLTGVNFNQQLYAGIRVGIESEMTPRQPLCTTPYAFSIVDGAITNNKLAAGAVGTTTIADGAVTNNKLMVGAVGTTTIANGAVTQAKLGGAIDGIPSGTIILWTGVSCPAGYTRLSAFDGMFPRGATTYGGTGGADTHNHGGSTASGGVDHTHGISLTTSQPSATEGVTGNGGQTVAGQFHTHTVIGSTGASSAYLHSHGISSSNNIPRYFNVLFCLKN